MSVPTLHNTTRHDTPFTIGIKVTPRVFIHRHSPFPTRERYNLSSQHIGQCLWSSTTHWFYHINRHALAPMHSHAPIVLSRKKEKHHIVDTLVIVTLTPWSSGCLRQHICSSRDSDANSQVSIDVFQNDTLVSCHRHIGLTTLTHWSRSP